MRLLDVSNVVFAHHIIFTNSTNGENFGSKNQQVGVGVWVERPFYGMLGLRPTDLNFFYFIKTTQLSENIPCFKCTHGIVKFFSNFFTR